MKNKDKKKIQKKYAKENINHYFFLLESRFYPEFDKYYVKEILKLSKNFNIRLNRREKLKFCKKCFVYWNINNVKIKFNTKYKSKDYICKNCGYIKRFRYK